MIVLRAAARSHTGYVRSANQDLALVSSDLVAIADGMGGHLGGEVAARTAIEELLEEYRSDRTGQGLVNAARRANRTIWRRSRVDRQLHGMGTTLTAAALVDTGAPEEADDVQTRGAHASASGEVHLALVNIGDSRAYVLEPGARSLRQLTEDHSVVEEMVRQGELTPAEAAVHPHRHVLTRALGISPDVALDVWDLTPEVGTRFLLCSDGLTNEIRDSEIAEVLLNVPDADEAADELIGRALAHGGTDNVTVVVLDITEGEADSAGAELVPPSPSQPEEPLLEAPDITEVVPVLSPGGGPPSDDRATEAMSGLAVAAALGAAGAADAADGAGTVATDASARTPGAPDDPATLAAATDAEAPDDAELATPSRRPGRSMTMRQQPSPPALDGAIGFGPSAARAADSVGAEELHTSHNRPVVLVPKKRLRGPKDRIVTFRVALFVILLAGLAAGTAGLFIWFNQSTYYITLHNGYVAIYQGRPGGLLWLKPQLVETSAVPTTDLLGGTRAELESGILESSLAAAKIVVDRLKNERQIAYNATTTTTTTSSSTTTTTTTTLFGGPPPTAPPTTAPLTTTPATTFPTTTTLPPTTTTLPPTTTTTSPVTTSTTRPATTSAGTYGAGG